MNCLRCHGLMVTIRLEDAGGSSLRFLRLAMPDVW